MMQVERLQGHGSAEKAPRPKLTEAALRQLLAEGLAQLLTRRNMGALLGEVLERMDKGERPFTRFVVSEALQERVMAELAAQVLQLGRVTQ